MFFQYPVWLLLLIPLAVSLWFFKRGGQAPPADSGLRIALLLLIVLAMTVPTFTLPIRSGTVIVLADRSASMPADAAAQQKQAVELVESGEARVEKEHRLELVEFAEKPHIIQAGSTVFRLLGENDGSDLTAAIETALSLIPVGDKGRLLILSDGRWTGENPNRTAAQLIARGIAVDYRVIERPVVGDIAVQHIEVPDKVLPDEVFKAAAWVSVPVSQNVEYELSQNGTVVKKGTRTLASGSNRLEFLLKAGKPGAETIVLHLAPPPADGLNTDPVPENNTAKSIVGVEGDKPLLVITQKTGNTVRLLNNVLNNAGIKAETTDGTGIKWSLEFLNRYCGIVLENVPSSQLGVPAMELIAEWVKETGTGLMFTGGKNSYALGGYYQSPFDSIMPVSMELRKEHRKLAVAVAIVMDRSGSMGMTVSGGKIKMDLANLGAAEVLKILTPLDEVCVMTCDTGVQTVVPMKHNTTPDADRQKILTVGPGGGGIFVYTALLAATKTLSAAKAGTKHIILFTDADDTEEPRDYIKLLENARKAGMTCSVIALGTMADSTAGLCQDIAKRGGGNIYFTEQANDLPRLFALDTFTISRQTFLEEQTPFHFTGGVMTLTGTMFNAAESAPALSVGGYNLSYIKPEAMPSAITDDEYKAPLLASWQAGLGRVLCFTGEVNGKFTGPIAKWEHYNSLLASLGKWTAGRTNELPNGMMLTQELKNGVCQIRLMFDEENNQRAADFAGGLRILKQKSGTLETETRQLQWLEPDVLGVNIPLTGSEVMLATLTLNERNSANPAFIGSLPPVCLPYSPEYRPVNAQYGAETLKQLAAATGGKERAELTGIWKDIPRVPRYYELTQWLIYAALALLVVEIFQRRTGLLPRKLFSRKSDNTVAGSRHRKEPPAVLAEKSVSLFRHLALKKEQRKTLKQTAPPKESKQTADRLAADSAAKKPDNTVTGLQSGVFDALKRAKESSQKKM